MKTILNKKIMALCSLMILISTAYSQQFSLPNVAGSPGQNVTVSLNITQAIPNAGAITLFFQFDEAVLSYVANSAVIVMPEATGTLVNKYPGQPKMGIAWSATANGVNFPTGTMLTMTFTILNCNNSSLTFLPAQCEVVDWDVNPINVTYVNGNVTATSVVAATWTGAAGNGDWGNPSNWNANVVPGCNTSVTIASSTVFPVIPSNKAIYSISSLTLGQGAALTVNGTLNIATNLLLQSGVAGTGSLIDNGTVTIGGNTTIERYYAASLAWHLISSPISNGLAGIYNGMYLQRYNEPTAQWIDIINPADPLVPAQGYALWTAVPGTYQYIGSRNTGNVSIPITNGQQYGWNLLGNPYPSSLDWNLVAAANPAINGAVYYLEAATGNYKSYNGGMGGGSQYVPPMQGFFVSAANAGTFQVNNTMRTHLGQNNYYKSDFENLLVLKTEGNNYSDATYLRFDEMATTAFDGQYDAFKLLSDFNEELPQIYTRTSDVNLSINVLPAAESVPLSFLAGVDGTYTISIEESYGMEYIFLEDLLTGVTVDLLSGNYIFDYSTGDNSDRFVLHFNLLSVTEIATNSVKIFSSGNNVHIKFDQVYTGDITVYDMMGREVTREVIESIDQELTITGEGFYVVTVTTNENIYTEKVYIK